MDQPSTNDQGVPMAQPPQSAVAQPMPGAGPAPAVEPPLPQLTGQAPQIASVPQAPPAPAAATPGVDVPTEAADSDVIEPEWVNRAKQVVAATHDDPFKQVNQLNQLKAEYMQKRYNKTVKLPDA